MDELTGAVQEVERKFDNVLKTPDEFTLIHYMCAKSYIGLDNPNVLLTWSIW